MSSLIKNELTKIFKKKSIYITLLVVLAFVILTNCIYKFFFTRGSEYGYSDSYITYIKEDLAKLDPTNPSDTSMYIDLKSQLDTYELMQKYDEGAWQRQIIASQVATYVNEKNTYLYSAEKDEEKANEIENKINDTLQKLENDDWRYFANLDLEQANEKVELLEEQKANTQDRQQLEELEISIENAKIDKEVAKYRVDKDIKYGTDYLNEALTTYQNYAKNIIQMGNFDNLEYEEKLEYNKSLEEKELSRYIIENKQDINKTNDTRGILKNFFSEYGLFIIVIVVMIAGTIVSEEFNKGTVKLLLIKPYSRTKILLSKYITILVMTVFAIAIILLMELIVGGIVLGYDSLSIPVVEYNFNTSQLEILNIFTYVGIEILTQLPMIILLATLAFALSTIFTNSALAITISLLGFMSPSIINALVIQYKVDFMRFFVTMNWDLSEYLFGKLPSMQGMRLGFSIIMCLIYLFAMIIPTFIIFKKKNIKNI